MNEQVNPNLDQGANLPATRVNYRDIALSDPSGGVVQLMPKNFGEIVAFSELMARADCAVRKHFRNNPGACMAVTLQAMRWQMDPFAVANKSYFVNDQLAYEAQMLGAVIIKRAPIKGRPKYRYEGEGQNLKCFVSVVTVDGDVIEHESPRICDIKTKNSPLWAADPRQQLGYFTLRAMSRLHFPDIILGAYDPDEIVESQPMKTIPDQSAGQNLAARLAANAQAQEKPPRAFDPAFVEREIAGEVAPAHDAQTGEITDQEATKPASAQAQTSAGPSAEELAARAQALKEAKQREAEQKAREEADAAARAQSEANAALEQQQDEEIDVAALIDEGRRAAIEGRHTFDKWFLALNGGQQEALKPEMPGLMKMANASSEKAARQPAAPAEPPHGEDEEDWDATLAGFEAKVVAFTDKAELEDWGIAEAKADWYVNAPEEIQKRAQDIFVNHQEALAKAAKKTSADKAAEKPQDAPAPDAAEQAQDPLADLRKAGKAAAIQGVRKLKLWLGKLNVQQFEALKASPLHDELMQMARQADEDL